MTLLCRRQAANVARQQAEEIEETATWPEMINTRHVPESWKIKGLSD